MNHFAAELQCVALTARAGTPSVAVAAPRVDLYRGIHKAARALMADTLMALGRMDPDDGPELAHTSLRVMDLLHFCRSHLRHQNTFVHGAMETRAPGSSLSASYEHGDQELEIDELAASTRRLLECCDAERPAQALALYLALSVFIGHNFTHMHVEETRHNAVLWEKFTDEELTAIHEAQVAAMLPEETMFVLRWLVPYMNPAERAALLGTMRARTPLSAFGVVIEVVRPHLTQREWFKLEQSLGGALQAEGGREPAVAAAGLVH